ncbi:MAG TPA: hypothetical protein VF313_10335 [Anaerolineaceae bacterium]|jgi:hypothetical protein
MRGKTPEKFLLPSIWEGLGVGLFQSAALAIRMRLPWIMNVFLLLLSQHGESPYSLSSDVFSIAEA